MSPTSYRTAPPRVTERNTNGSITLRLGPGTSTVFAHHLVVPALAAVLAAGAAQQVVRTADPVKRGLEESDLPRTVKVADNIYTYEDFHASPARSFKSCLSAEPTQAATSASIFHGAASCF